MLTSIIDRQEVLTFGLYTSWNSLLTWLAEFVAPTVGLVVDDPWDPSEAAV